MWDLPKTIPYRKCYDECYLHCVQSVPIPQWQLGDRGLGPQSEGIPESRNATQRPWNRWYKMKKPSKTGWWLGHPSEKYERQLGWWNSQYMGKFKKWQPNHQPENGAVMVISWTKLWTTLPHSYSRMEWVSNIFPWSPYTTPSSHHQPITSGKECENDPQTKRWFDSSSIAMRSWDR